MRHTRSVCSSSIDASDRDRFRCDPGRGLRMHSARHHRWTNTPSIRSTVPRAMLDRCATGDRARRLLDGQISIAALRAGGFSTGARPSFGCSLRGSSSRINAALTSFEKRDRSPTCTARHTNDSRSTRDRPSIDHCSKRDRPSLDARSTIARRAIDRRSKRDRPSLEARSTVDRRTICIKIEAPHCFT